jgi:hypothetical protein
MRIDGPAPKDVGRAKPILRNQIIEAQQNTKSNMAAARWLNVNYLTYKKYAMMYDLFYSHMNQEGIGVQKGYSHTAKAIPISAILANKHRDYNLVRLKKRLINAKMLKEECGLCGFCEKRIGDGKIPLLLTFKDTPRDFTKENLIILCYNCIFLTTGSPVVAHKNRVTSTMKQVVEGEVEEDEDSYEIFKHEEDTGEPNLETLDARELGINPEQLYRDMMKELKTSEE